jgi:hypothetical protein
MQARGPLMIEHRLIERMLSVMTDAEEQIMIAAFREFDRGMIHEKYQSVVETLEKR